MNWNQTFFFQKFMFELSWHGNVSHTILGFLICCGLIRLAYFPPDILAVDVFIGMLANVNPGYDLWFKCNL